MVTSLELLWGIIVCGTAALVFGGPWWFTIRRQFEFGNRTWPNLIISLIMGLIIPSIFGYALLMIHIFSWIYVAIFNAIIGVFVAKALSLGPGNALLFVVLCASASYLAVPAAMRMTVPEAKSSYYISTTLGLTFPFNIVIGIPMYMSLVNKLIPSAI